MLHLTQHLLPGIVAVLTGNCGHNGCGGGCNCSGTEGCSSGARYYQTDVLLRWGVTILETNNSYHIIMYHTISGLQI